MAIVLVLAIGMIVISAVSMAILPFESTFEYRHTEILKNDMATILVAMQDFRSENPLELYLSPLELSKKAGNEYLRFSSPERLQFESAKQLNDGVWLFDRAAIWFESQKAYIGKDEYLLAENNACGNYTFANGGEWCGRKESLWSKIESKRDYSGELLGEKQRLYRTIRKFYSRYSKDQSFVPVANGQARTLAGLVGFNGTAKSCGGIFTYNEIPLGCEDLFNYWGIPVVLNKISNSHIVLVNRTNILSSAGQPIRLAEEAKLE